MNQPLAHLLRPENLSEIIGQKHLVGKDSIFDRMISNNKLVSMILYGPPGSGKTTLAMVLAKQLNYTFRFFNAVTNNKKDLEVIFAEAKLVSNLVLIIDEVHRLNKDKQDLLLPHIENGTVILIGATTANPYFSINPAIRSRVSLFEVKALTTDDIKEALIRAISSDKGLNNKYSIDDIALNVIANFSNGDIRYALNTLELVAFACKDNTITVDDINKYAGISNSSMDATEEGHYNNLSGFQKSIRGSDVNGALYYLAQLAISKDLDSIERRLLVIAYEDIGLGNPAAVGRTLAACDTARRVGFPEAIIPLGMQVIDLALSPKSKTACNAIYNAMALTQEKPLQVLDYLKYTPVGLTDEQKYSYDKPDIWPLLQYLPNEIKNVEFIEFTGRGKYEEALMKNYYELKKHPRSNDIVKLNRTYKSK